VFGADLRMKNVYLNILKSKEKGKKLFAVLIDPDKFKGPDIIESCNDANVDIIMVGGSLITQGNFAECINTIKKHTSIPVVLFPGSYLQVSEKADGILLLSLISGRNPEMLIGNHVVAATALKKSGLEIIPTGYMLIESGKQTSASYMSNTTPIPFDKEDIAVSTAIAGEQLGLKLIYLEAGSGALKPVGLSMIDKVSKNIKIPLVVGGGINTADKAINACKAGADIVVVGTAIEKETKIIKEISEAVHLFDKKILLQ
jgi:phosphoglycerol geranylgeranyltransferase